MNCSVSEKFMLRKKLIFRKVPMKLSHQRNYFILQNGLLIDDWNKCWEYLAPSTSIRNRPIAIFCSYFGFISISATVPKVSGFSAVYSFKWNTFFLFFPDAFIISRPSDFLMQIDPVKSLVDSLVGYKEGGVQQGLTRSPASVE